MGQHQTEASCFLTVRFPGTVSNPGIKSKHFLKYNNARISKTSQLRNVICDLSRVDTLYLSGSQIAQSHIRAGNKGIEQRCYSMISQVPGRTGGQIRVGNIDLTSMQEVEGSAVAISP